MSEKITAVVLAAGRGKRMGGPVEKQYMELAGCPLICHALRAFEASPVDDIVLVCGRGEEEFCRTQLVDAYGFTKVRAVVCGGAERYDSVYEGLKAAAGCDYVLIHDGARPCVTDAIIRAAIDGARQYKACVIAMPVKDTIKVADADEFSIGTPPRSSLWAIQTPQAFAYPLVFEAYRRLLGDGAEEACGGESGDSGSRFSQIETPFSGAMFPQPEALFSGREAIASSCEPVRGSGQTPLAGMCAGTASSCEPVRVSGNIRAAVTDDAMVVEQLMGHRVRLIRGSYENIKVTTPEDLEVAEIFLKRLSRT